MGKITKAKINDVVEVIWLDALCVSRHAKDGLSDVSPKDMLILTKTYGIYHVDDGTAIMILQEDSDSNADFTVIPTSLISEINVLRKDE
jgi:hypothetical protein